ncbi:MAG: acetate--CoA ligase family protein, partial [Gammaproteobacteria bacterium]|nr:acetate--CoA ligase family protein [Gammaproteobacteria bacterium]
MLKTVMAGITHKSDVNEVKVNIASRQQLEVAYQDLQTRLGNRVVVMPMIESGVEVSVGMKNDPQYGPLIIVTCVGVLIDVLAVRAFKLAPV